MRDTDGNDSVNWSEDEIMDLTVEAEDDEVADHMDAHGFDLNMLPEEAIGEAEIDLNTVPQDVPDPEVPTRRKRRFYPNDLKIAIYLELLAKIDPPIMHHGVTKACALKFRVPLGIVQTIWYNGQHHGGVDGVKNKYVEVVAAKG
ncbi:hypothetical protein PR202_ga16934 [Eleusine coracana subsp. coracana]|uniref:Uncharacterized protein n=1 Tax=Eleusine coracana subsp. coracana TaxID=191504 RepID=A0AAV5CPJ7_ELECO|nr:hypothetical protein PR202_ga16934 [Eleusine coracana subsp. coracana]